MTRKDYILIANALKARADMSSLVGSERTVVLSTAVMVANALSTDNPRFSTEHFLAVVRGEKDLNSRPARTKPKANSGLVALANHAGWRRS